MLKKEKPVITYILLAVNIFYFLFLEAIGNSQSTDFMLRYGAAYTPYILEKGEYWRLVTSMFMHFGIEHIANNMLILYLLGSHLEKTIGKWKYGFVYFVAGIGANVISVLVHMKDAQAVVSAGASGAVFALAGGVLAASIKNRGRLEELTTRQLAIMIVAMLWFGFSATGVDNVAHVSGAAIGFLLTMILFRPKYERYESWSQ